MTGTDAGRRIPRAGLLWLLALLAVCTLPAWWLMEREADTVLLPPVDDCRLDHAACSARLPDGSEVVFDIHPRSPNATDPLRLEASFAGGQASAVSVRFEGVNMDMGYLGLLKYQLTPTGAAGAGESFAGDGGVFACSAGWMDWRVLLDFELDGVRYEVPFQLRTTSTGN